MNGGTEHRVPWLGRVAVAAFGAVVVAMATCFVLRPAAALRIAKAVG